MLIRLKYKKPSLHLGLFIIALILVPQARAQVTVGVAGMGSLENIDYQEHKKYSSTISLSVSLGSYLKLGLNYRRASVEKEGYNTSGSMPQEFRSHELSSTYSANIIVVLYNGLVSPYIFGGRAYPYYETTVSFPNSGEPPVKYTTRIPNGAPNYGFGTAIYLNRRFSLKVSQTYSPVTRKSYDSTGEEVEAQKLDSYTQVGINYNLF